MLGLFKKKSHPREVFPEKPWSKPIKATEEQTAQFIERMRDIEKNPGNYDTYDIGGNNVLYEKKFRKEFVVIPVKELWKIFKTKKPEKKKSLWRRILDKLPPF